MSDESYLLRAERQDTTRAAVRVEAELRAELEQERARADEAVADLRLLVDEQAREVERLRGEVHDAEAAEIALGQRAATLAAEVKRLQEALAWVADRYAATLAGRPVRDADEALYRARLLTSDITVRDR